MNETELQSILAVYNINEKRRKDLITAPPSLKTNRFFMFRTRSQYTRLKFPQPSRVMIE